MSNLARNASIATALVCALFASTVRAGEESSDPCCDVAYVEKEVMVPKWVKETREVMVTEYRMQDQERVRMVCNRVPYQKDIVRTVPVCVPEVKERVVNYTVCVPVRTQYEKKWVDCVPVPQITEQVCTVMVPRRVQKQGTKMVCETYQEEIMCTVSRDAGQWATKTYQVPVCGGCCCCGPTTCTVTCKVWVPNIVTEKVPRQVTRTRMVPKPYTYYVTVCEPQQQVRKVKTFTYKQVPRSKMVSVVKYKPDVRQKKVKYTSYRTEYKEVKETITCYRTEMEEVREMVPVCVPVQVKKNVEVCVCRYEPQMVKVPVSTGCDTCCPAPRCGLFARIASCCRSVCCN